MREEDLKESKGAEGVRYSFTLKGKAVEVKTLWQHHRNLYLPIQKHTNRVIVLDTFPAPPLIGDGVVTRLRGVEIGVRTADCAALVLLGEEWVGVAHVGWRGLASGIVEQLVNRITAHERRESLFGFVGPSAKACCYEVGKEFRRLFPNYLEEREGRLYMDLQEAVLRELKDLGVPNTGALERCTVCSVEFPSYRRDRSEERILTSVRIL